MRDQILDAVERLLVRDGVDAVRLDAVAREAGVSKGGLLHHFPSKRALVQGVVVRLADRFDAVLPEPGSPPGAFTLAWLDASIPEESPTGDRSGADHVPLALLAAAGVRTCSTCCARGTRYGASGSVRTASIRRSPTWSGWPWTAGGRPDCSTWARPTTRRTYACARC